MTIHQSITSRNHRSSRRNRITIAGVYIWYSPSIQAAVRNAFSTATKVVLKIGSSDDIVARNAEACGEETYRSTHPYYGFEPRSYAGISDWQLYRYTTQLNGSDLLDREKELQSCHPRLAAQTWEALYHRLTGSRRPADVEELYFTTIDQSLLCDFPILYPVAHDAFVLEAEHKATAG
ncbi:MAG: hypothetical protein EOO77_43815 [Oxalobacteraceae bacterium]|nr:MAG: hypothetical protein EOO77_43815 [Oxalobacteraceae bacterium]